VVLGIVMMVQNIQTTGADEFGNYSYVGGTTTVTGPSEYKNYFRNISTVLGKRAADKAITYGSEPIYKGKYELDVGTTKYTAGDLVKIIVRSLKINSDSNTRLRIMSIDHNFQGGMWTTTLNIEEDMDLKLLG